MNGDKREQGRCDKELLQPAHVRDAPAAQRERNRENRSDHNEAIHRNHQVIRLEHQIDRHVGDVHFAIFLGFGERIEAGIFGIPRARRQEARAARNRERSNDLLVFFVNPAESVQRRHLVVIHAFHHGQLRGLLFRNLHRRSVGRYDHRARCHDAHHGADAHGFHREIGVLAFQQIPRPNRHGYECAQNEQRHDHVRITRQSRGIEGRRKKIGDNGLRAIARELGASRRLHPRIGNQNPQCAQARASPHEPCRHGVELRRHLLFAKEKNAKEDRFQEEGEQGFGGERRTENIAHEARVIGPVGSEGELHGDARRNANGERRREDAHPEMHSRAIFFIAASIILRSENRRDKAQAYRKRNEYEMVGHRYRELNSREQRHVKQRVHFLTPLCRCLYVTN